MSTAKRETKTAVPRLRFPVFRDVQGWCALLLEELEECGWLELGRGNVISAKDMRDTPGAYPVYSSSIKNEGYMGSYGQFMFDEELISWSIDGGGDFFYRPHHKFSVTNVSGYMRLKTDRLLYRFVASQLQSLHAMHTFDYQLKAHPSVIRKLYRLGVPSSAEQQKIADCLTSLDGVIAAQGRKVEALKAHKRGLMQQLFPREGETRPRLRFPEFRDAPEWMQQRIEAFARDGLTNGIFNDTKRQSSSYRLINVSEMYLPTPICESDLAFAHAGDEDIKKKFAHNGDIFFTRSSLVREGIAYSNIYLGVEKRVTFDGHLIRLRPKLDVVVPIFLHYALKSDVVRSQFIAKSKSATMTTIGQRDVGETGLAIPQLEEQQRIADCLTSLDTRITAETNQLAALKTHKQGLMQQLFPVPEAAGA